MLTKNYLYYIAMLPDVAKTSHDLDTQTAAIIVSRNRWMIQSTNVIPSGVKRTDKRATRPEKYTYIMHAERAVIAMCALGGTSTYGARMYLNWFPCSDCVQMITHSGVKKLYAQLAVYEARKDDPRYGFMVAMEMLKEAKVEIVWF